MNVCMDLVTEDLLAALFELVPVCRPEPEQVGVLLHIGSEVAQDQVDPSRTDLERLVIVKDHSSFHHMVEDIPRRPGGPASGPPPPPPADVLRLSSTDSLLALSFVPPLPESAIVQLSRTE